LSYRSSSGVTTSKLITYLGIKSSVPLLRLIAPDRLLTAIELKNKQNKKPTIFGLRTNTALPAANLLIKLKE